MPALHKGLGVTPAYCATVLQSIASRRTVKRAVPSPLDSKKRRGKKTVARNCSADRTTHGVDDVKVDRAPDRASLNSGLARERRAMLHKSAAAQIERSSSVREMDEASAPATVNAGRGCGRGIFSRGRRGMCDVYPVRSLRS